MNVSIAHSKQVSHLTPRAPFYMQAITGGAAANSVSMQLSARTLAARAAQVCVGGSCHERALVSLQVLGNALLILCCTVLAGTSCLLLLHITTQDHIATPVSPTSNFPCHRLLSFSFQDKIAMTRRRLWAMVMPLAFWLVVVIILWLMQHFWISGASERVLVRGRAIGGACWQWQGGGAERHGGSALATRAFALA